MSKGPNTLQMASVAGGGPLFFMQELAFWRKTTVFLSCTFEWCKYMVLSHTLQAYLFNLVLLNIFIIYFSYPGTLTPSPCSLRNTGLDGRDVAAPETMQH